MIRARLARCHRSLTIKLNAVLAAVLAGAPTLLDYAATSWPQLAQYANDADWYRYGGLAVVALNMALRFKTTTDLAER